MNTFKEDTENLLGEVGDAIAEVFEQMVKGQWVDDNGHKIVMNNSMFVLKQSLVDIMVFREKHLDYSAVPDEIKESETKEEGAC